jgi:hypothetical protein
VRVDLEHRRHLLDHHVVDQGDQLTPVVGPGLDRPAVDHDPRRHLAVRGEQPSQRDIGGLPGGGLAGRHVLDGELDVAQLGADAGLQAGRGVEDQLVELHGAGGHRGDRRPGQRAAHAVAVPVPAVARARSSGAHGTHRTAWCLHQRAPGD